MSPSRHKLDYSFGLRVCSVMLVCEMSLKNECYVHHMFHWIGIAIICFGVEND